MSDGMKTSGQLTFSSQNVGSPDVSIVGKRRATSGDVRKRRTTSDLKTGLVLILLSPAYKTDVTRRLLTSPDVVRRFPTFFI